FELLVITSVASHQNCTPILRELLSENLCPNSNLNAALFTAIRGNNAEAIKILMQYGAHDANIKLICNDTPLELANQLGHIECAKVLQTALQNKLWALIRGKAPINDIEALISNSKMNLNPPCDTTPLYWATWVNNIPLITLFLKYGAIVKENMLEDPENKFY